MAVDGGAGDAEHVGDLLDGMPAAVVKLLGDFGLRRAEECLMAASGSWAPRSGTRGGAAQNLCPHPGAAGLVTRCRDGHPSLRTRATQDRYAFTDDLALTHLRFGVGFGIHIRRLLDYVGTRDWRNGGLFVVVPEPNKMGAGANSKENKDDEGCYSSPAKPSPASWGFSGAIGGWGTRQLQ